MDDELISFERKVGKQLVRKKSYGIQNCTNNILSHTVPLARRHVAPPFKPHSAGSQPGRERENERKREGEKERDIYIILGLGVN
jgi:hypothetical protein